jgi:hypothetical protein
MAFDGPRPNVALQPLAQARPEGARRASRLQARVRRTIFARNRVTGMRDTAVVRNPFGAIAIGIDPSSSR